MALATKPKKRAAYHKKRVAQHHRHSKLYLKPYLPYLPMLLIVGLGLFINSLWNHQAVLGAQSDLTSLSLLQATNQRRQDARQAPLRLNSTLSAAAQAKAEDMAARDYWSHTGPDRQAPWALLAANGYQYRAAGENLAYGFASAGSTVAGWMSSQAHRDNLLNRAYTDVGFGVASSPNFQGHGPQTIVVAEYAQPADGTVLGVREQNLDQAAVHQVARIELLTGGNAGWSVAALSALTGAAATLFLIRHGYRLKRALNQGEAFVAHHPYFDIAIVAIITLGLLLSRSGGLIH